jgi:hypothetical protein
LVVKCFKDIWLLLRFSKLFSLLILSVVLTLCLSLSCNQVAPTSGHSTALSSITTPNPDTDLKYQLFEIKADDRRLIGTNHPLYSFEYPKAFSLIDVNKLLDYPMNNNASIVDFILDQENTNLPEQWLRIRVEPPVPKAYTNASEASQYWVNIESKTSDNITTSTKTATGLQAIYLKSFYEDQGSYRLHMTSFRMVTFDYAGFIWEIFLTWNYPYHEIEPPEIEEYFNHIIGTFKILG